VRKYFLIAIFFLNGIISYSQIWYEVKNGLSYPARNLFADTLTNQLFVAGNFEFADTVECRGVGIWSNGNWSTHQFIDISCSFGSCGNQAFAILRYNNETFASGMFGYSGDTIEYLRKWDGISWSECGKPNSTLLIDIANNELFALGWFDSIDNVPVNHIGKWNGVTWDTFGGPTNIFDGWSPWGIEYLNGDYYVFGNFSAIPGYEEIAKWDGTQWLNLQTGIIGDWVDDAEAFNGYLFVGGIFYQSDGNVADFIVAWDGAQWIDPFPNVQYIDQIRDIDVINGDLYIVGAYQIQGDTGIYGLARYDGVNFCAFGGSGNYPYSIEGMNDTLYVITDYMFNGDTMNYIAQTPITTPDQICSYMPLEITENFINESLNLFPNPVGNSLNIQVPEKGKMEINIYSVDGKIICQSTKEKVVHQNLIIDTGILMSGIYFVAVKTEKNTYYGKFIKN